MVAMRQGQTCIVTRRFTGKKVYGPFYETFEPGTRLIFMRHRGDEEGISVFTTLHTVNPYTTAPPDPGSLYEAKRDVFEAFTAATQK